MNELPPPSQFQWPLSITTGSMEYALWLIKQVCKCPLTAPSHQLCLISRWGDGFPTLQMRKLSLGKMSNTLAF